MERWVCDGRENSGLYDKDEDRFRLGRYTVVQGKGRSDKLLTKILMG